MSIDFKWGPSSTTENTRTAFHWTKQLSEDITGLCTGYDNPFALQMYLSLNNIGLRECWTIT